MDKLGFVELKEGADELQNRPECLNSVVSITLIASSLTTQLRRTLFPGLPELNGEPGCQTLRRSGPGALAALRPWARPPEGPTARGLPGVVVPVRSTS